MLRAAFQFLWWAMPFKLDAANAVTAAEISRNFGEWQSRALSKPVVITHHGRTRLILMSVEEFEGRESGDADHTQDAARTNAQLRSILGQIQEGFLAFDQDLNLRDINRVGELYLGYARQDVLGRDLRELIPVTRDAIHWNYYKRVLRTGEPIDFTARSTLHKGAMISVRAFPYEDGVGSIFSNITIMEEARLEQRWWNTFQAAVRVDPSLAIIRLNVRGGIASVDENFCTMTGFSEEQLGALLLSEIVHPHERIALARAINDVLRDRGARIIVISVMGRDGGDRRLKLTMGAALDEPVAEGIIACVTDLTQTQASGLRQAV